MPQQAYLSALLDSLFNVSSFPFFTVLLSFSSLPFTPSLLSLFLCLFSCFYEMQNRLTQQQEHRKPSSLMMTLEYVYVKWGRSPTLVGTLLSLLYKYEIFCSPIDCGTENSGYEVVGGTVMAKRLVFRKFSFLHHCITMVSLFSTNNVGF